VWNGSDWSISDGRLLGTGDGEEGAAAQARHHTWAYLLPSDCDGRRLRINDVSFISRQTLRGGGRCSSNRCMRLRHFAQTRNIHSRPELTLRSAKFWTNLYPKRHQFTGNTSKLTTWQEEANRAYIALKWMRLEYFWYIINTPVASRKQMDKCNMMIHFLFEIWQCSAVKSFQLNVSTHLLFCGKNK